MATRYVVQAPHLIKVYHGKPTSSVPRYQLADGALKPYSGQPRSGISRDRQTKARDRLYATNLLLLDLKHAYRQPPPCDAKAARKQHANALFYVARFLERIGPDGDRFADRFAVLAQMFLDVDKGIPAQLLSPAVANRGDPTMILLARVEVVRAVETLRYTGYTRKEAVQLVVKKQPGLERLITEKASPHRATVPAEAENEGEEKHRSGDLETAIISGASLLAATTTTSRKSRTMQPSVPTPTTCPNWRHLSAVMTVLHDLQERALA